MNKAKVRRLALALLNATLATRTRGRPIGFNMASWFRERLPEEVREDEDKTGHKCGTNACMAGWAYVLDGGKIRPGLDCGKAIPRHARISLGLDQDTADLLFVPNFKWREEITPQQAALVLFNLAETGKVDWRIAGYQ